MNIEHFNIGRNDPVAIAPDDSEIRLRLLELADWARFNHPGYARLVDSESKSHLLAPDDVRQLVADVRRRQSVAVTVHKHTAP